MEGTRQAEAWLNERSMMNQGEKPRAQGHEEFFRLIVEQCGVKGIMSGLVIAEGGIEKEKVWKREVNEIPWIGHRDSGIVDWTS